MRAFISALNNAYLNWKGAVAVFRDRLAIVQRETTTALLASELIYVTTY